MKSMPVHQGAFTVLRVFDCDPGESERFARELGKFVATRMRFHPGFVSSLVYLSEDACKVVELSQWARAGDWEAYCASDDGREAVQRPLGRSPAVHYLEMVRATGLVPPGEQE